jgi:RNA polymerase sigma factor (TIGR02999 family)
MGDLTILLERAQAGDDSARSELFALAYRELHQMAHARLRGGGRHALLDTTSLVHDSYLRFVEAGRLRAGDRRAFFAYASQIMRSVIVDSARQRLAQRHGGDAVHVTLTTQVQAGLAPGDEAIVQVHEALAVLEQAEPRLAATVEMRYFGGYTEREIAEALDLTERTVRRDWDKARLLLEAALS